MSRTRKLAALALDPAAPDGEWQAAAIALIRHLRKTGERFPGIEAEPESRSRWTRHQPDATARMPFGKYRGWPLTEIARQDPDYLGWLLDRPDLRPWLREAIHAAMHEAATT